MKTGDNGADGEPFFREDPDALGRIYVEPYLKFEPELALMLEDSDGVCGYALGALDSKAFFQRYEGEWRPQLVLDFPEPRGDSGDWTRVQQAYHLYHHPDYFCPEPYSQYPSHIHIDLLPRAQGKGFGRKMIEQILAELRKTSTPGVHLGMSVLNPTAYGFYCKLGFKELARDGQGDEEAIYLGMIFKNPDA
jgi:ribosomal protein S18 acetylase RimI-like enzyme